MQLIIITKPDFFSGETDLVNRLFELGMPRLHLRKPKATAQDLAEWIEQIALPFRHNIVLHDHHDLVLNYQLGGVHLNGRNPLIPIWMDNNRDRYTVSRSCHSLDELCQYKASCDYLFLSPIFDSISKEGYGAAFSREALAKAKEDGLLTNKVYALGGISLNHRSLVHDMGFGGAAVLGALWQADDVEAMLKEMMKAVIE